MQRNMPKQTRNLANRVSALPESLAPRFSSQPIERRITQMKSAYLTLPIAAALIPLAAHYEMQVPAARAAEHLAPSWSASVSTDSAIESELVGKVIIKGQAPRN